MKPNESHGPIFESTFAHIEKRPGMWFGIPNSKIDPRSLSLVQAFITGFQHGQNAPNDLLDFKYFTRWVAAHYRVRDGAMSGFCLIMEKVGGDEQLAFDEFFRLLPLYKKDLEEIGPDGIANRYEQVMGEIFVKKMRDSIRNKPNEG
jgi:hypothetical protein